MGFSRATHIPHHRVQSRRWSVGLYFMVLTVFNSTIVALADRGRAALLIIDVQDCFLPGGSLAVNEGSKIIPVINSIRQEYGDRFAVVALSKDWHPPGHVSFASAHGKDVHAGDQIQLSYLANGTLCRSNTIKSDNFPTSVQCPSGSFDTQKLQQVLWPEHCVQNVTTGSKSSDLADTLTILANDVIIYKGTHLEVDSYSAFYDNGDFAKTSLDAELKARNISTVFVTGLALDYCVYYTSKDARTLGYKTYLILDATQGINEKSVAAALEDMQRAGVHQIKSDELKIIFSTNGSSKLQMSVGIFTTATALLILNHSH